MKEKERAGQPPKAEATPKFLYEEEWLDNAPSEKPTNNLTTEEWEALRPELGRNEFIRQRHERVSALEADTTQLHKEIKNTRANVLKFSMLMWKEHLIHMSKPHLFRRAVTSAIHSIKEFVQNGEMDKANTILSLLMGDMPAMMEEVALPSNDKRVITNRFTQIEGYSQLEKADEFIALVSSIAEMPQSSEKGGRQ